MASPILKLRGPIEDRSCRRRASRVRDAPFYDQILWIDTGLSKVGKRESEVGTSFLNRREGAAVLSVLHAICGCMPFAAAAEKDKTSHLPA